MINALTSNNLQYNVFPIIFLTANSLPAPSCVHSTISDTALEKIVEKIRRWKISHYASTKVFQLIYWHFKYLFTLVHK